MSVSDWDISLLDEGVEGPESQECGDHVGVESVALECAVCGVRDDLWWLSGVSDHHFDSG